MASMASPAVPASALPLRTLYPRKLLRPCLVTVSKSLNNTSVFHIKSIPPIPLSKPARFMVSASVQTQAHTSTPLSNSTRNFSTILSLALSVSRVFPQLIQKLAVSISGVVDFAAISSLQQLNNNLVQTVGPAFFAAMGDRTGGVLHTPLTVVAAGLAKWLDIYSGVLLVRVLLSWFPNIPWDRQPLSAIRDLCDPYLNLFRNIIPPVFDTLDVSPLLAFAVLGTLASILNGTR